MGVTALWAKLGVEVSWTKLSDTGKGREDEDDEAECPDVDTDRVEKFGCIGWIPDNQPRAGNTDEQSGFSPETCPAFSDLTPPTRPCR